MSVVHDPYAALRRRDFRCLLSAGVLASIGAEIQAVAVGYELYERTEDAAYLGWAGLAQFLPVLLLALPAGQASDRFSRKYLLQLAQAGQAITGLALAMLSVYEGPVALMFLFLVLSGICRAFSAPARSALVSQVVPAELLPNAVTWNSSAWQVANVSGPALGGLALSVPGLMHRYAPELADQLKMIWDRPVKLAPPVVTGPAVAYVLAAVSALVCVILLFPVQPRELARTKQDRSLRGLLAGLRFVLNTRLMLAAITLDLFAVLLGGATALLPVYAKDILHVGPIGFGLLRAAPAVGAVLMALVLAHRPPLRKPGQAMLLAVAGFGVATIVFGLSGNFALSLLMLALTGALDNISVVVRGTLMQTLTPDDMRGRVAAVNVVFISSSNELGAFESGMTADWFGRISRSPIVGTIASVVVGGIGTIGVVVVAALVWPSLLAVEKPAGGAVLPIPASAGPGVEDLEPDERTLN